MPSWSENHADFENATFRELAEDFLNYDPDAEEVTMSAETNLEVSRKVQDHFEVKGRLRRSCS